MYGVAVLTSLSRFEVVDSCRLVICECPLFDVNGGCAQTSLSAFDGVDRYDMERLVLRSPLFDVCRGCVYTTLSAVDLFKLI